MHTSTANSLDLSFAPSSPSDIVPSTSGELSLESLEEVQGGVLPVLVAFAAGVVVGFTLSQAAK